MIAPIEEKVLDYGFVRLVDMMGDDWSPAKAARVSYASGLKGEEADTKLLRYLYENRHTSPFEQVVLQWEVQAPIFVFREWHRHRTASLNEFSMRYANPFETGLQMYHPAVFRSQDGKNKQGSGAELTTEASDTADWEMQLAYDHAETSYNRMIELGVARELARIVLPVGMYSTMVWQSNLHNTWHFLDLRTAPNAQWEIRQYALAMERIMTRVLPVLMGIRKGVK